MQSERPALAEPQAERQNGEEEDVRHTDRRCVAKRHSSDDKQQGAARGAIAATATQASPVAAQPTLKKEDDSVQVVSATLRGGPAQAMRTFMCIFTKLFPLSRGVLPAKRPNDSGGNCVKMCEIKKFLEDSIGQAPKAEWGLNKGADTFAYIAELFNWALEDDEADEALNKPKSKISSEAVQSCLSWSSGEKWKVDWDGVFQLGVCPNMWPVPFDKKTVRDAQKNLPSEKKRVEKVREQGTASVRTRLRVKREPTVQRKPETEAPPAKQTRVANKKEVQVPAVPTVGQTRLYYWHGDSFVNLRKCTDPAVLAAAAAEVQDCLKALQHGAGPARRETLPPLPAVDHFVSASAIFGAQPFAGAATAAPPMANAMPSAVDLLAGNLFAGLECLSEVAARELSSEQELV